MFHRKNTVTMSDEVQLMDIDQKPDGFYFGTTNHQTPDSSGLDSNGPNTNVPDFNRPDSYGPDSKAPDSKGSSSTESGLQEPQSQVYFSMICIIRAVAVHLSV